MENSKHLSGYSQKPDLTNYKKKNKYDSFLSVQFQFNRYKYLRKDRDIFGGGFYLYISKNILSK